MASGFLKERTSPGEARPEPVWLRQCLQDPLFDFFDESDPRRPFRVVFSRLGLMLKSRLIAERAIGLVVALTGEPIDCLQDLLLRRCSRARQTTIHLHDQLTQELASTTVPYRQGAGLVMCPRRDLVSVVSPMANSLLSEPRVSPPIRRGHCQATPSNAPSREPIDAESERSPAAVLSGGVCIQKARWLDRAHSSRRDRLDGSPHRRRPRAESRQRRLEQPVGSLRSYRRD